MNTSWTRLRAALREAAALSSVANLLGWDQETMMPSAAADARADQLSLVGRLAHERMTDPRIGEWLAACEDDPELLADPVAAADLREIRRDYDRARLLPPELVAEISETASRGLEAWKEARASSDFEAFRPWLERQLDLARRKAECWGASSGAAVYDALLDEYEPGTTAHQLETLFGPLRAELSASIDAVARCDCRSEPSAVRVLVPVELQREFNRRVLERLGFDADAGRLDVSTHPFATGLAPGDTRITTRYAGAGFADALGSTVHEAGHAMYEQGLPRRDGWGLPRAEALGLGIHESQSRLWENHVYRSRAMWSWALPLAREVLGDAVAGVDLDDVWAAVNAVRPCLIRVDSDELTYNLHVMLRFDLERSMLSGDLPVAELPAAWNRRMREDLGLDVPDDARGCLQDIHWAMGSIGYFPTYTLGTLYAAQFYETARAEIPGLEDGFARGEFAPLLEWLRERIHRHGRRWTADELCRRVTGRPLGHDALLRHLDDKLERLYGVSFQRR